MNIPNKRLKWLNKRSSLSRLLELMLLFFSLAFLYSCDCLQRMQGYVIDADNRQPIPGVWYTRSLLTNREKLVMEQDTTMRYKPQTGSTGWFQAGMMANGFNCKPHMKLWLEKAGYQSVQLEWKRKIADTLIIELKKID